MGQYPEEEVSWKWSATESRRKKKAKKQTNIDKAVREKKMVVYQIEHYKTL